MAPPVKYIATIYPVTEVSLLGTADLGYWQSRLEAAALVPLEFNGRAQILISGVSSQYLRLPFRELSISIVVRPPDGSYYQNAVYMTHAYNSSQLLAWCERAFFSTPYFPAAIRVEIEDSAFCRVAKGEAALDLHMTQAADRARRAPTRTAEECWEGPIFLPVDRPGAPGSGNVFFARLSGETQVFPYDSALDRIGIEASNEPALQALMDSGFAGREWLIRSNATHARSKTFVRSRLLGV